MTLKPEELREAMRNWTSGIVIVTAAHEGNQHGMTVSSFTSLSLEPPLVSVSLYKTSRTHGMVSASGRFGATILAADQEEISNIFAGRVADTENRFEGVETQSLPSGIPAISGGLTFLDCRVKKEITVGTNTLFIAEVENVSSKEEGNPLIYFNQGYRTLG